MRFSNLIVNLALSLTALVLLPIFLEIGLRGYYVTKRFFIQTPAPVKKPVPVKDTVPLHIVTHSPVLYGLNPQHPEISSQGLRNDEVTIPKPKGTFRILVLGDSVAYGVDVPRNGTFSNRLEDRLRKQFGSVDVINSGVAGYTAYNELQYYLTKGREFEADIVMVAFCMNDVVNPRLHWMYTEDPIFDIPADAIPNHDYDLNFALPRLVERGRKRLERLNDLKKQEIQPETLSGRIQSLLKYSELYGALEPRIEHIFQNNTQNIAQTRSGIPTYITGEENVGIEVLLDKSSPEWRWLTSIYDRLHNAVQADNAKLIIVFFPLAYQLDVDYPFLPQKNLAEYCKERSIFCLDLLPPFRQYPKGDIFFVNNPVYYDIWHLTEFGHELSAREILRFLQEKELVRGKRKEK